MMGHKVSTPVVHDKHQNTAQPGSKGTLDSAPEGTILRGTHSITSSTNFVSRQALSGTTVDGCWLRSYEEDKRHLTTLQFPHPEWTGNLGPGQGRTSCRNICSVRHPRLCWHLHRVIATKGVSESKGPPTHQRCRRGVVRRCDGPGLAQRSRA